MIITLQAQMTDTEIKLDEATSLIISTLSYKIKATALNSSHISVK